MNEKARAGPVVVEAVDGVSVVSLNRPERLNALDMDMATALAEALSHAARSPDVTAVVIAGRGKAFCAGGDLGWVMRSGTTRSEAIRALASAFHRAIVEICGMRKPVVAAVNGVAAGGGFSLALACDFRVLNRKAVLRHAYTSAGLTMDGGSSLLLPRLVGHARALEIVAFDAPIDAERATALGLVTELAEGDAVQGALAMAHRLKERALHAFGFSKHLLAEPYRSTLEAQLAREEAGIGDALATAEGQEGVNAFVQKRRPDFARARAIPPATDTKS